MSWTGFTPSSDFVDNTLQTFAPLANLNPGASTQDTSMDQFLTFDEDQALSSRDMQIIGSFEVPLDQQNKGQEIGKFDYTPMADICVCDSLLKNDIANLTKIQYERAMACL
jgi:hypothetical protein